MDEIVLWLVMASLLIGLPCYRLIKYRKYDQADAKCISYTLKSDGRTMYYIGRYEYDVYGTKYIEDEIEMTTRRPKKNKKCKVYVSEENDRKIVSGYWKKSQIDHIIIGVLVGITGIVMYFF